MASSTSLLLQMHKGMQQVKKKEVEEQQYTIKPTTATTKTFTLSYFIIIN
jgi:hypothetical protein